MITTVSLVNIYHLTVTFIFLVMRPYKIYSLSNFQITIILNHCVIFQ